ncbi:MAG: septum formation protein Maf [Prevotella sp.]|nr:septum formation protein Maf [Prevotella sp.]
MHLILASNSPRRKELLAGLGLDFDVRVIKDIDETYPSELPVEQIPMYISEQKAKAYLDIIHDDELVITADTVVVVGQNVLGKPRDRDDACEMLRMISGCTHQVITGVCLTSRSVHRTLSVSTDVTFKSLSEQEISFYVDYYKPYDKAGAYGIQEWIGYIGVTSLEGSYFNVMGLPVQRIWQELLDIYGMDVLIHDDKAHP